MTRMTRERLETDARPCVPPAATRDDRSRALAGIVLATMAMTLSVTSFAADDALLKESRAITQTFAASMQTALQSALTEGGPTRAIGVCKDVAPKIASALSRRTGAKVARVSRRYRNAANAPEPWQREVLEDFERRGSGIVPDATLEYFERGNGAEARYMKGIRAGAVCLVCHGASLSTEVREAIEAEYPHDRAQGYEAGDLRGAFSVTWPRSE